MSQVCGLNYALEGPLSEPVLIKPDSEYPDWLFKMDIKRPKPTLAELVRNFPFLIEFIFYTLESSVRILLIELL